MCGATLARLLGAPGEGETHWRFYPESGGTVLSDENEIFQAIICHQNTLRAEWLDESGAGLIDWGLLQQQASQVGILRLLHCPQVRSGSVPLQCPGDLH